jgi:hypothetical protein
MITVQSTGQFMAFTEKLVPGYEVTEYVELLTLDDKVVTYDDLLKQDEAAWQAMLAPEVNE